MMILRCFALLLMCFIAGQAHAGTVRIGVFVGNNVGFGGDAQLEYAEGEARAMSRVFQDMGALARDRSIVLQGATASTLRDTIARVEGQVREVKARGDDVMLLFYYSGHATRDGLQMAGTEMPMEEVRRWLESSSAKVRVAFVDACESGELARIRGGQPVDAIEITVDDSLTSSGLAVVASTGPLSVARESSAFGGGIFSKALMTGLRGSADRDADGVITLDEAYGYAFEQTVLSSAASSMPIQKPEYLYEISGVGEVVLTRLPSRSAELVLPEELEGVYTVVSVTSGAVVSRIDKQPGEVRRLSLPTGRYVVRKVRREDVLLAEVDLVWGGARWVDDQQMSVVALGDPLARGAQPLKPWTIHLAALVASPFSAGNPLTVGGQLGLRVRLKRALSIEAFASYQRGERSEELGLLVTQAGRGGVGVLGSVRSRLVEVLMGGGVEVLWFGQDVYYVPALEGELPIEPLVLQSSVTTGGVWAGVGLHVPFSRFVGLDAGVKGHLVWAEVDQSAGIRFEAQAQLGVAVRFGRRVSVLGRGDDTGRMPRRQRSRH